MNTKLTPLLSGIFLFAASPAFAALTVSLSPSVPTAPVGATITWTATVSGDSDPTPSYEYEFTANLTGTPTLLRRGFSPTNTYVWTPNALEGAFTVGVTVKNTHANTSASNTAPYTLTSRLPAGNCATNPAACAAVNTTNNPLVALFTGTSCLQPNNMVVFFKPTSGVPTGGITALQQTTPQPCRATAAVPNTASMNFYVAGMYPSTTYEMYYETITPGGSVVRTGPTLSFTTGAVPSGVFFPTFTATGTTSDPQEPITLHSVITVPVNGHIFANTAVDLVGNVLWYSTNIPPMRTEIGGNYTGIGAWGTGPYNQGFREVDLAGNTVLEMSAGALSEQLVAAGQKPITEIHHEFRRIYGSTSAAPNNYFVMLAASENISPSQAACIANPSTLGAQGGTCTTPVDIFSDQVVVLNSNMGLVWNWDETKFFDLNQTAFLDETCGPGGGGCPPITATNFATNALFTIANDWTHTNSVQYTTYDGNFIVSSRHQDVVYKINYGNGSGDGHVMWELGPRNFKDVNGNPLPMLFVATNNTVGSYDLGYPWNSHQHDSEIQWGGALIEGARILTLFDDGNSRVMSGGFDPGGNSRCLLYAINETAMWANLNVSADVGTYSFALGSAQTLANGSMACDSGIINQSANTETTENPITGTATVNYSLAAGQETYRTFRMSSLYNPVP